MNSTPPTPSPVREAEKAGTDKENSAVETLAYQNPAEGLKKIQTDYEYWTRTLTRGSFELSVALIAANWAVFGTVDHVLNNPWSKGSVFLVVVNVAINLLGALVMSDLLRRQWEKAEAEPDDWRSEWKAAAHTDKPWPFTTSIQCLGKILRWCKVLLPLSGGVLFLVGLLTL